MKYEIVIEVKSLEDAREIERIITQGTLTFFDYEISLMRTYGKNREYVGELEEEIEGLFDDES